MGSRLERRRRSYSITGLGHLKVKKIKPPCHVDDDGEKKGTLTIGEVMVCPEYQVMVECTIQLWGMLRPKYWDNHHHDIKTVQKPSSWLTLISAYGSLSFRGGGSNGVRSQSQPPPARGRQHRNWPNHRLDQMSMKFHSQTHIL